MKRYLYFKDNAALMRYPLLLILIFLWPLFCHGQIITLHPSERTVLGNGLFYVEDGKGRLEVADFAGNSMDARFQKVTDNSFNNEVQVYWLRFSVINASGFDREWVFDFENWAFVEVYFEEGKQLVVKKTGHLMPFRERNYPVANQNFILLPLKNKEMKKVLVRLESRKLIGKDSRSLSFSVAPRAIVDAEETEAGKIVFAFLGLFAVMFLYNLFIFVSTKLRSYAYYLLGIFFVAFHTAGNSGYIFPIFGSVESFPSFFYTVNLFSSNLWGVAYILFVQSFLLVRPRYPFWNKALWAFIILYLFAGLLIFFFFEAGFQLTQILGLATILVVLILGVKSVKSKYPSATYFLLGNAALFLGLVVLIFALTGLIPKTKWTFNYALPLGSTVEILFFSFALANMIKVLRMENDEKQEKIIHQLQENQHLQNKVNRELEQMVADRTHELEHSLENLQATQAQLIQKEKMASLGELTAGIAHEIQNPLNFVNNFSEVSIELAHELKDGPFLQLSEPERGQATELVEDLILNLGKIHSHGQRADSIVKGMLEHSRSSSGTFQFVDLNGLVKEYLRLSYNGFRVNNKGFSADLKTDLDPALEKVKMAPQDIGRVLLNIFNNAFYALQEKAKRQAAPYQPQLWIRTLQLESKVELCIKDNGIGIPQDILNKIYQPFFTTKPTGSGTGLGLSLTYDIITKEHHGEIKVHTTEGEFTEFVITLPIRK